MMFFLFVIADANKHQTLIHLVNNTVIPIAGYELGEIYVYDRISVQVLIERCVMGDFQVGKKCPRVARAVVVSRQHLRRHRLAEAATAADTGEAPLGEQRTIYHTDQSRLVDVLAVADFAEGLIASIDIYPHCNP